MFNGLSKRKNSENGLEEWREISDKISSLGFDICHDPFEIFPVDYNFVIIAATEYSDEEIISSLCHLSDIERSKIIIFGFHGNNWENIVETLKVAGLASHRAVINWLESHNPLMHRAGVNYGLIGLKEFFREDLFDPSYMKMYTSENYLVYELIEANDGLGEVMVTYMDLIRDRQKNRDI